MKKIFLKIFVLFFCFGVAGSALAIGMLTEPIVVSDALRGGEFSETITVFNPDSGEVVYKLGDEGDIKGWVTFFEKDDLNAAIEKVNVPPKEYYDVIAKIKVPDDVPNGGYAGGIFVAQEPKEQAEEGESSVSVSQMVSREVRIVVTDQEVIKLNATLIPEKYDIRPSESLKIKVIYENEGNVSVKPDLQLKITSITGEKTVFNAIFPYPETEEAVKPREQKALSFLEWPANGQENGKYRAEIKITVNGETMDEQDFKFNIDSTLLSAGGSDLSGKLLAAVTMIGAGNVFLGWFVLGFVLVFSAAGLVLLHVRRRNKKKAVIKKIV